MSASIEDEWRSLAKAGARRQRRLMIPAIVGIALFFATTLGTFLAVGSAWGEHDQARKDALAKRGLVEVEYRGRRTVTEGEKMRDAGAALFLVAIAAGLVAGGAGFFATGGRLSTEHLRGLSGRS